MSATTLHAPPARPAGRVRRPGPGWAALLAFGVPVAALSPLLAEQAAEAWGRPHYQFFPFALLGAAVLTYARVRDLPALNPGRLAPAAAGLFVAWVLAVVAAVGPSSLLAAVAAVAFVPAAAYAVGGRAALRAVGPACVLALLAVPPPAELDRHLIQWLQALTTKWASGVLDALGVFHLTAGNVIEVDGKRLLVDQACSGVNSLLSVLACTLFVVFLARRGAVRGGLLLIAAVGWVVVGNVARVVAVAAAEARWGLDLSAGWRHEALGIAVFLAAVGLILSTDQLLGFFATPRPATPAVPPPAPPPSPAPTRLAAVVVPAYLLVLGLYLTAGNPTASTSSIARAAPAADALPPRIGPWEQTGFRSEAREAGNFFGGSSQTWTFRRGELTAVVSFDHPFVGWHDLTRCYTAQGWVVCDQAADTADPALPGGCVVARLGKAEHRSGFLLFCEFDPAGTPFRARTRVSAADVVRHSTAARRWADRLGVDAGLAEPDPPGRVYQVQAFAEGYAPLTGEEEAAVRELFTRAQELLRADPAGK
jgi:exosortase